MISNPYAKQKRRNTKPAGAAAAPSAAPPPNNNSSKTAASAATRKAPPPSSQRVVATTNTAGATTTSANSLPTVGQNTKFSTFSQAFESIEDSEFYHQTNPKSKDGMQQQERARQRAFEQQHQEASEEAARPQQPPPAGTSTNTTTNTMQPPPNLSDRDHHVLLQQPHVLYVSVRQRGNEVLEYIRNVPTNFQKMVPDYIFNSTSCALFLSIKYHNLYPDYIHKRIAALKTDFTLRILLVLVDCQDNAAVLLQLNKLCVTHNLTLILSWSPVEAARYLETLKAFDGKDATLIQRNKDPSNFVDQVTDFLTTCKTINKTDAASILGQFGSVKIAMAATPDELALIGGLGQVKVKRLYDAFHKPFSSKAARKRREERERQQKMAAEKQDTDTDTDDDDDAAEKDLDTHSKLEGQAKLQN